MHHIPDVTKYGTTASADRAVLDGARGLARVGAALAQSPDQRSRLQRELTAQRR